ncbi:hypothetical protein ACHAWF_014440 [Thalassiosira exigua]
MPEPHEIVQRKRKRGQSMAPDYAHQMKSPSINVYQTVDLHRWIDGWGDGRSSRVILPLVDLRSREEFDKRHLSVSAIGGKINYPAQAETDGASKNNSTNIGSGEVPIVNLPLSTLLSGERTCELPPRHVDFAILIPRPFSETFQRNEIHELFFANKSKSTLQSRKPWLVRQVIIDNDSLWKDADEIGLVRHTESSTIRFRSLPRLWKPDPLVSSDILPLLKGWVAGQQGDMKAINDRMCQTNNNIIGIESSVKSMGIVLDLGSGAGRDVCYLAEELKEFQQIPRENQFARSVHFVGIDNHKGSAKRCTPLWKNRGVDDISHSRLLNLNNLHSARTYFMAEPKVESQPMAKTSILCIYAIRFLNRRLLSFIADSCSTDEPAEDDLALAGTKATIHSPPPPLVLPLGTLIAVSHFCKPEEGATWNFDHPKESNVLDRWELMNMFGGVNCQNSSSGGTKKWIILKDNICSDGDHGRTLIQFVVRKVA